MNHYYTDNSDLDSDRKEFTYYFGSAWSNYDVRTLSHWQLLTEEYLSNIRQPLSVQLENF